MLAKRKEMKISRGEGTVEVRADTVNKADRSVEVIWTTGSRVKRYSFDDGWYMEELSVKPEAIRTVRFASMSLLDNHNQGTMDARLGTVVPGSVRIEGGQGYARVRFSSRPRADAIFRDLVDGHTINISVGYKVHTYRPLEARKNELPVYLATDWEPMELSVVTIGADPDARSRSNNSEGRMAENESVTIVREEEPAPQKRNLLIGERRTVIADLAKRHNIDADDAEELVQRTSRKTELEVRGEVLNYLADRDQATPTFPVVETRGMVDERDTTRRLVANAILHREGFTDKLEDGANQFRDMSAMDIARDLLRQRGESTRGAPSQVLERALHNTSDFPIILGDVGRQTLMTSYGQVRNTFQLIAHRNVVPDLREVKVIDVGSAPDLLPINEHGEYKSGTIKESDEGFSMAHYGRTFGVTEAVLINDTLGGIMRAIANWGRKVAKLEGDLVWRAVIDNAKLKDGKGIFHADHKNLASEGTVLDKANLLLARKAFRLQKDIDGEPTDIAPKYLFTGSDLEIDAQTLIAAAHIPTTVTDTVPQAIQSLVPIYEPRLDKIATRAWFLFAGKDDTLGRGLQYSHLAGFESPRFKEKWGFEIDGVAFRIDHYFGAGVTDFRFAYKNPGIDPNAEPEEP